MPYYMVKEQPVFLHARLYKELEDQALKDWPARDRILARVAGPKANEAYVLMGKLLDERFLEEEFSRRYVYFDLAEEEAQLNVWDLLYDFCNFRRWGRPVDQRSVVDRVLSDYQGEAYDFPMGRAFELHFPLPRETRRSWFSMKRKTAPTVRFLIATDEVNRLQGDLNAFTVSTSSLVIRFDANGVALLSQGRNMSPLESSDPSA